VVVEGVEEDRDAVVARPPRLVVDPGLEDAVALQDARDHVPRLPVERPHPDVERLSS
jgi:hypothetical protein